MTVATNLIEEVLWIRMLLRATAPATRFICRQDAQLRLDVAEIASASG